MSSRFAAGSWLRKEFELERKLESALHPAFYAIFLGVQSSRSSSTRDNRVTSLLPCIGTVIRFPIGHASYGLFRPLIMIGSDMEAFRGSICTVVERITGYESQSTGFGMTLDAAALLTHSLGTRMSLGGAYASDEVVANRSGGPSGSHGVVHMPDMDRHRSAYSLQEDMLPGVLI